MPKITMCAAAAALALIAGAAFAQGQQGTSAAPGQRMGAGGQGDAMPMMRPGAGREEMRGPMQGHPRMGDGPGRGGMGPHMMLMMMALVDTDASETLSLDEVQAVHARLFQYADSDDDGELTLEELRAFMHGQAMTGPR